MKTSKHIRQGLLIISVFLCISRLIADRIGVDQIHNFIAQYPVLAPFVIIVIKAATVIFAPLSGTAIYAITGTLFPMREGVLYMIVGNAIGISIAYRLGKKFGLHSIKWMFGSQGVQYTHDIIDRVRDPKKFIITRFVLFPLEDLINYVAGMAGTSFRIFFLVSMITSTGVVLLVVLSTAGIISFGI